MELNNIKGNTSWEEASGEVNANNRKIVSEFGRVGVNIDNVRSDMEGLRKDTTVGLLSLSFDVSTTSQLTKPTIKNPNTNETITLKAGHATRVLDKVSDNGEPYYYQYDGDNWNETRFTALPKDVARKEDIQPIKVRDYFAQSSTFFNIPLEAIISIKALSDWSGSYEGKLFLWYVNNGDGADKSATIYINRENANGEIEAGNVGIIAQYLADNSAIKQGQETIVVKERNLSSVNFEIVINWDKVASNPNVQTSSNTILDSSFFLRDFSRLPKNVELNNNLDSITENDIFLVNKVGDYLNLPVSIFSDLEWTNGSAYSPTGVKPSVALCYSDPQRVEFGSTIKYKPIPSSSFCHVLLDANDNIVEAFGSGGSTWDAALVTKKITNANVVSVVFSWAHATQLSQYFKAEFTKDSKVLKWSDLTWIRGASWRIDSKLAIAGNNSLSISKRVKVQSNWIATTMVPSSVTGFACFGKNDVFLGVINQTSGAWDNVTKQRLFHGTKSISLSYSEGEKDKFSLQEVSDIDFSIKKEGLYQVHANNRKFSIEPLAYNNLEDAKKYTDERIASSEIGGYDYMANMPILPPQIFLRSDKPVFLYRKSMLSSLTNSQGFGVTLTSMGEKRKVIDIQEPTAIGYDDIDNVSTKFVVQQFNAINKMVYKDVKVYKVLVDTLIGKVVKIMSLGDSLSEGVGKWTGTPVCMLATILRALGIEVQFVGSLVREMMNKGVAEKISYEGRGGWRYPTLIGWESQFAGLNQIIPTDQTKSKWELGVDGASMNDIKINNPFLFPATAQDLIDYPEFCFHFVVGNAQLNKSYAEDKTLGTYHIFDPSRYFTLRNIEIPDILTMAFGTNEWYLNAYGGFNVDKATKSFEFIVRRFRQAAPNLNIIVIPAQPLMSGRDEQWRTQYSILCSSIMKAAESKIEAGDNKILVCPLYAQGSRFWSFDKFVGVPAELTTYNSVKEGVMDLNVHYNDNNDDESNSDYAEHLAACALNAIKTL